VLFIITLRNCWKGKERKEGRKDGKKEGRKPENMFYSELLKCINEYRALTSCF